MKMFSKVMLVVGIVFTISKLSMAQGEAAIPFLQIAPDAKSSALGESGTALADNSAAIFWNPAGLAFQTGGEVSITHSNWLPAFKLDLFYDYLTFKQYVASLDGTVSGSVTYMNYGKFTRTGPDSPEEIGTFSSFDCAATIGYATKVHPDVGLGFNFRVIYSNLSDKPTAEEKGSGTATTVSFDVGAMWRPSKLVIPFTDLDIGGQLSLGVNLSNLGPKIYYIDQAQADPIPTNFRLGLAYKIIDDEYNSLVFDIDFSKLLVVKNTNYTPVKDENGNPIKDYTGVNDSTTGTPTADPFYKAIFTSWTSKSIGETLRSINTSMGLEYWYGKPGDFLFALRAGFFYEDPSFGNRKFITFGAGIRYDIYGFDFSYITTDVFPDGANHPLNNTLRFSVLVGWDLVPQKTKGFPKGV